MTRIPYPVTGGPKGQGHTDELSEREEPKVQEMMDLQIWEQRRKEMLREVEQNRLAKALRDSRKRRGAGRTSSLAWELKRIAGRLLKRLRSLKRAGQ